MDEAAPLYTLRPSPIPVPTKRRILLTPLKVAPWHSIETYFPHWHGSMTTIIRSQSAIQRVRSCMLKGAEKRVRLLFRYNYKGGIPTSPLKEMDGYLVCHVLKSFSITKQLMEEPIKFSSEESEQVAVV